VSSEEDEDGNPIPHQGISNTLQRSIDRLINASMQEGHKKANGEKGEIVDESGKIKFDRRIYDI